jgi:hypothetical protein
MSATNMLLIGYGLALLLYGGYWLYLLRRQSKARLMLDQLRSRKAR